VNQTPDPIAAFLTPLLGTYSWAARRVHGSIVSMDFGTPTLTVSEPNSARVHIEGVPERLLRRKVSVHGEWYLAVELCVWTLVCEEIEIATSSSDQLRIERGLWVLNGQALREVEIRPDGTSFFRFDLGCILGVWPEDDGVYDEGSDAVLWWLLGPGTDALAVRADGRFSIHPRDAPRDTHIWQPIPTTT
jgi:hypothetical protein